MQSSLNQTDLIASATEKKLAEMSLNLRNSIPKERLDETGSFRKNKTFEFSRANKLPNDFGGLKDFGSTLPQISELPTTGQDEEITLEVPFKIKKKPQPTSTNAEAKKAGKGKPKFNLDILDEATEEPQAPKIETEKTEEETKVETPIEEPKKEEEFVLEKPFPKAGDLKRKNKKNLAIVSEDNEEPGPAPEIKKRFGLSIDTSDKPEENQQSQVEQVQEKEKEVEKPEVKEEQKEEPKEEFVLPKSKARGKGLGMGKKKFGMAIELDVDAINQEFTFGGEKGQKNLDENDMAQIMEVAMKEVYRLAQECAEYMSIK